MHSDDSHKGKRATSVTAVAVESTQITLDLYRTGRSGIPFKTLRQFIGTILTHYQIELDVDLTEDDVTEDNLDDMTLLLDVLETAAVFWEYCELDAASKPEAFSDLKSSLLGPYPSREDALQFPVLVAAMEQAWGDLTGGEPSRERHFSIPQSSDISPISSPFIDNGAAHYGPDNLDVAEAFALFARPLLEDDSLYEDPDSLDEAMMKAQAYWDLAHLSSARVEKQIDAAISRFTTSKSSTERIKKEAFKMIQRFHELFPERK